MLLRMTALAALAVGLFGLAGGPAVGQDKKDPKEVSKLKPEEQAKVKKALGEMQDFIGQWNLEGTQKDGAKIIAWKEKVSWGWNFKGDPSFTADFNEGKGKYYTGGSLKYDLEKKLYVLSLTNADKTEQVFEGKAAKDGGLKLERKDAKTGDVYRLTLNTLSEGDKFQVKFEKQDGGKGLFNNVFAMNGLKEGAGGVGVKKPECIVSGGAANIAVSFNGKTYYVCCTGCRDEFNANPKKYAK
ncbi:MAG: YHS domain-containing protein [Planctomycetes bacterium]|nr:YHS domain-containing protein [Planctomycetota bacterium]